MAQVRLRPGPWTVTNSGSSTEEIQIDYEKFEVAGNATADFWINKMGLADDSNFKIYRNPVSTVQSSDSTGSPVPSSDPSLGK